MTVKQYKDKLNALENQFILCELSVKELQTQWEATFDMLRLARRLDDAEIAP